VNPYAYALLGLTVILAVLVAILVFAVLRFSAAAKDARRHLRENGERAFVTGALQEALDRMKAQERAMSARAAASEQLSDQIVSSLTAGLLVISKSGAVQILNPAGRQLLGLPPGPLPPHFRQLLAGATPLADALDECLATGQPIVRRALEVAPRSGATHLGVTVSPLAGNEGQPEGAICLFSDLTAVVDLEEQLRLKDALARVGELTAGIAHEFRNGLATIHGYSRLIDPAALPPAYRPYVEGIRQETQSLGQVVTNFLNFARPEQIAFHPVDVEEVVRRAVDDTVSERDGQVDVKIEGEFAVVQGDEVLLRQAFSNLLRNAVEACEGKGIAPAISVVGEADAHGRSLKVSVHDNGPGIDESTAARVFRPFFTTKARGTGLGLAIVQKVVVTHNGRVTVGASPRGGACIQVTLPIGDSHGSSLVT
jgi:signal transduction histidine kinase